MPGTYPRGFWGRATDKIPPPVCDEIDSDEDEVAPEPKPRTVGISLDLWFFPEFDQWKLGITRNAYNDPILAVGPFRAKCKPVRIWR